MNYLDTKIPYILFEEKINSPIYVDKSMLIDNMNSLIRTDGKNVCITRPRRFGKSMNATMLGAYYTKGTQGYDSHELFDNLSIAKTKSYEQHINKHHVIYIDFSRMPDDCESYKDYINDIRNNLREDLYEAYPKLKGKKFSRLDMMLNSTEDSFIFILDEWDSIFYKKFMSEEDKIAYLDFLNGLLKGQAYVELVYMTGVLPIAKYSSGSALNTFKEYNFMNDQIYDTFFGFSEDEVHDLCDKFKTITYDDLKYWYDGYKLHNGQSLFNPRSVSNALTDGVCLNYWTETGPMNEIADCIEDNVDQVRDVIVQMVSGISVEEKLKGFSAGDLNKTKRKSKDLILSAMVVYGFLSYHKNYLQIPNHELMLKFEDILKKENMGKVAEIVNSSEHMLTATIQKDAKAVAQYLREVHAREVPLLQYNDENSLSCVITLCYLKARDYYRITREEHSGEGYVDFLFRPVVGGYPAIVLELKCGHSAEEAIKQIKSKNYMDSIRKEKEVLLVGINYDKETKEHTCIIEEYK